MTVFAMRNHGGARPGAGRKAVALEERKVTISARVLPDIRQWIDEQAEEQGVSVGRIIEVLVTSFIQESKKEG